MSEDAFLRAMRDEPDEQSLRLVFADWLEEQSDPRAELLRLTHLLTTAPDGPDRPVKEGRLRALLAAGVQPVGPRWTNRLGMEFAFIPTGTFLMGSPPHEPDRQGDETRHRVTLTRGFYMGVYPVTQGQWRAVMGANPSRFRADDRPVECVSWHDCQEFCRALAVKDSGEAGFLSPYRLPTEAEWEFACRAGTTSPFYFGETLSPTQANFHINYTPSARPEGKYRQQTTPVGMFPGNAWGLRDTHGNVFEWCADWYAAYPDQPVTDPEGEDRGEARVLRGGSWHSLVSRCRSACRAWGPPAYRGSDVGCRVCVRLDHEYAI